MDRRKFLSRSAAVLAGAFVVRSRSAGEVPRPEKAATTAVVLGTAQDGGVPQAGCRCPNCLRARNDPKAARAVASLGLYDWVEGKAFLIDATPDLKLQLDRIHDRFVRAGWPGPAVPEAVVLSHAHVGHYAGLIHFGYESMNARGLPVCASSSMAAFLTAHHPWKFMVERGHLALRTLVPGRPLALTPRLTLVPFLVPHRDELSDTMGFRVSGPEKSLVYIPDIQNWTSWPGALAEFVSAFDYALLDGTFFGPEEAPGREEIGHPLIQDSLRLLQTRPSGKRTAVFFTHFNHGNPVLDPEGQARKTVRAAGCGLAEENQEFGL